LGGFRELLFGTAPESAASGGAKHRDGRFFAAVAHMLDPDSLRQAVADSVPPAMQKLNLQAFDKGFEYGAELVHRLAENGDAQHALALESES
jgi:hypothetical protein